MLIYEKSAVLGMLILVLLIGLVGGLLIGTLIAKHILIAPQPPIFLHQSEKGLEPQPQYYPEAPQPTTINNHYHAPQSRLKARPVTLTQPTFQPEPLRPTEDPNKYHWKGNGGPS